MRTVTNIHDRKTRVNSPQSSAKPKIPPYKIFMLLSLLCLVAMASYLVLTPSVSTTSTVTATALDKHSPTYEESVQRVEQLEHENGQSVSTLLRDDSFKTILSIGFGIYAMFCWFNYFVSFHPESAFTNILTPAIMTFMAFKWQVILTWFGL